MSLSNRGRGRRTKRLQFERLEGRSLLAVVSVDVNIYQDAGGVPGERITDESVHVGDTFFLEITTQEHDPRVAGLQGVAIDLTWDASVLQAIETDFDPASVITTNLPIFHTGTLDNQAGFIRDLGGSSFPASGLGRPIGSDGNDRNVKSYLQGLATTDDHFAWLHFRALQPADASTIAVSQGGSRIATMPVLSLSGKQLDLDRQTITVIGTDAARENDAVVVHKVTAEVPTPPSIDVTNSSGGATGGIQFTTVTDVDGNASAFPLVRPAFPDVDEFVDVTNTGDTPLTIFEIRVNAPDVTVFSAPTAGDDGSMVISPGRTERFKLTYAPKTPHATDAAVQSFDFTDGIVIRSDAANAPVVEIGLRGDSTFDADTNYDGQVDLADLISFDQHFGLQTGDDDYRPQIDPNGDGVIDVADLRSFAANFHHSREVPFVGAEKTFAHLAAEGEGTLNNAPLSNACVIAPGLRTNASLTPQDASRSVPKTRARSISFIGPVLPHESATHLIFAQSANQLTRRANPNQLDDELVDVLATDLNSRDGRLMP